MSTFSDTYFPAILLDNEFFAHLASVIESSHKENVYAYIRQIQTLRNIDLIDETDRAKALKVISLLGYFFKTPELFSNEALSGLLLAAPEYLNSKGTESYIDFLSYVINEKIDVVQLFEDNYTDGQLIGTYPTNKVYLEFATHNVVQRLTTTIDKTIVNATNTRLYFTDVADLSVGMMTEYDGVIRRVEALGANYVDLDSPTPSLLLNGNVVSFYNDKVQEVMTVIKDLFYMLAPIYIVLHGIAQRYQFDHTNWYIGMTTRTMQIYR
jgi:hypothetical protein